MNVESRPNPELLAKFDLLLERLSKLDGAVLALSGGVDSTVLAKACKMAIKDKILAVTSTSAAFSRHEIEEAKKIASFLEIPHILLETEELSDPNYVTNGRERCYFCRKHFFTKVKNLAREMGITNLLYGANLDDLSDYRPGMRAAAEEGVLAPLIDFGFRKRDIRDIAFFLRLPNWDKPSSPCLSTRIPHGSKITVKKLKQIEEAEGFLREKGFRNYRVRHHGRLARVEISEAEFDKITDRILRSEIVANLKRLGFQYVTLDMIPLVRE